MPSTSCADAKATCGKIFDGCQDQDCGTCQAPYMCGAANTCVCPNPVTATPVLEADTSIANGASTACGSIGTGDYTCINISDSPDHPRGLIRFPLDAATETAIATPGAVFSAKLTVSPAANCGGGNFMPLGTLEAYVMRHDWSESFARWCHRDGPTGDLSLPWGSPGANDPVKDHDPVAAGTIALQAINAPFDVPLDPAKLSSPLQSMGKIAFMLLPTPGSELVILTQDSNPSSPVKLTIEYCPSP